ncbi:MAG: EamA family transporter [Acidimicrobiales bacterium]
MISAATGRRMAPWIFVVLWSTGFVAARYATEDNGPLAFLTLRMIGAAVVLAIASRAIGRVRITRRQIATSAIAGVGINALYLGGVFVAIDQGMSSALSALISGLHPVVTAVLASLFFGEQLRPRQWLGVGLGLAGVIWFTLSRTVGAETSLPTIALLAMAASLAGMVGGTLVQRRFNSGVPLLAGTSSQYVASAGLLGVAALTVERQPVVVTTTFSLAIIYAIVVLSVGAILLMLWLLQQGAAAHVSSLFFLAPGLSAIEAAVLFSERIDAPSVAALALSALGVVFVMRT